MQVRANAYDMVINGVEAWKLQPSGRPRRSPQPGRRRLCADPRASEWSGRKACQRLQTKWERRMRALGRTSRRTEPALSQERSLQEKVFSVLGFSKEEAGAQRNRQGSQGLEASLPCQALAQFGFLMGAFEYGNLCCLLRELELTSSCEVLRRSSASCRPCLRTGQALHHHRRKGRAFLESIEHVSLLCARPRFATSLPSRRTTWARLRGVSAVL